MVYSTYVDLHLARLHDPGLLAFFYPLERCDSDNAVSICRQRSFGESNKRLPVEVFGHRPRPVLDVWYHWIGALSICPFCFVVLAN